VSLSEPSPLGTMKYTKGHDQMWARVASHRADATRGQATPPVREAAPGSSLLLLLASGVFW
jgi:hypothetical protein